ncbi:lysophospholipid acyltransferase family protein [Desulfurobacterium sp.]|uniref:lysophospholipid acyltransferase family protein n=1 Tax=Desulfurobacterium sp. TaxID=2004706 RepID=UPI002638EE7C|nr:lysophospholipid acyltransferase family protein [Desulfurobacterium sp.]
MKETFTTLILNAYLKTLRIEIHLKKGARLPSPENPGIYIFWHGRMLILPFVFKDKGQLVKVLISRHRDGEEIAGIIHKLGFGTVRGSTGIKKGGDKAFRNLVKALQNGYSIAITPDGPRGPREKLKAGVAKLSMITKIPVFPVTFSTNRGKALGSWDRFLVPYPFSKCKIAIGEPLIPETDEDLKTFVNRLELSLKSLTQQTDGEMGWKT